MPLSYYLAAVDTLLACLVTAAIGGWSGYMRGKHKIQAPAVTGHPSYERAHRAHSNTVENLVLMLPLLWIASVFYGGQIPFWLGLLWVLSRIVYAIGYAQTNPQLRAPGYGLSVLALMGLIALSVVGLT
ncbi:MAG TPA: MAPEG family protein [Micropepsaceae bacterium]|jgi:uncharacterized MAPEG superfamily protein|nr:MAPEG family protein [Micropepsaceae bacterium]